MDQVRAADHRGPHFDAYPDQPSRSPWISQLAPDGPPRPLDGDASTDVAIVGAGIAGIATAFFTLRSTTKRVMLIERCRVGRGATGRNAGQLTTDFERPLCDIADEFGVQMAVDAQRAFDDAHDLLDTQDDRYRAVLSDRKGCASSAALVQQVLAYLEQRYPDRFRFVDHTGVDRVAVGVDGVVVGEGSSAKLAPDELNHVNFWGT